MSEYWYEAHNVMSDDSVCCEVVGETPAAWLSELAKALLSRCELDESECTH